MESNLAITAIATNILACLLIYATQELESRQGKIPVRHSIIPRTNQQFLYCQDMSTMLYGDIIGLSLMNIGFFHLACQFGYVQWFALWLIAATDMAVFRKMMLSADHKPDAGVPRIGELSLNGKIHLFYHGLHMAAACLCGLHLIVGSFRGLPMVTWITGVVLYLAAFFTDVRAGVFAPLNKQ